MSLLLSGFEMAMPVVGLLAGRGLGAAIGDLAPYIAGVALLGLGGYMLLADESGEGEKVAGFSTRSGLALFALGLSISVDELTIGLSAGLLGLSILLTVLWIAAQAFVATQVGLRLGARLGEEFRERAEWVAGIALVVVALVLLALRLARV